MSWDKMRERGGIRKGERVTKLIHEAKEVLEELCDELEDMEEFFGERDREREDYEMRERRGRNGRYMR